MRCPCTPRSCAVGPTSTRFCTPTHPSLWRQTWQGFTFGRSLGRSTSPAPGSRPGGPGAPARVLVRTRALAEEMVDSMAGRPVVVLRGHGLTNAAATVEQAVPQSVSVGGLARLSLKVLTAGGTLADLPDEDMAEFPELGAAFNTTTARRHELARLRGVVDPEPF
nr:class II aldolase/adducin family protein [Pseudonocardia sp. WMMC193]